MQLIPKGGGYGKSIAIANHNDQKLTTMSFKKFLKWLREVTDTDKILTIGKGNYY